MKRLGSPLVGHCPEKWPKPWHLKHCCRVPLIVVSLALGFLEFSSPCGAGRLRRDFVGGVKDGGAVRIGAVPLGFVDLMGEVGLGFDPKILESIGQEGACGARPHPRHAPSPCTQAGSQVSETYSTWRTARDMGTADTDQEDRISSTTVHILHV